MSNIVLIIYCWVTGSIDATVNQGLSVGIKKEPARAVFCGNCDGDGVADVSVGEDDVCNTEAWMFLCYGLFAVVLVMIEVVVGRLVVMVVIAMVLVMVRW